MDLIEYKNRFFDIYGTPYKKCSICGEIKPDFLMTIDKSMQFNIGSHCKSCQTEKDRIRLTKESEREKAKQRVTKHHRKKGVVPKEVHLARLTNNTAPRCNIMLCKCEITGKDFYVRKTKIKPIVHKDCTIKGDYARPELLAKALHKYSRFHTCTQCDKSFDLIEHGLIQILGNQTGYEIGKFCSIECRTNYKLNSKTEAARRRRARERTNKVEVIRPIDIYRRDKFKCWICNEKVILAKGKDNCYNPKSATLDHVIPLSKGGTHTKENIKTACRQCNSIKSDSIKEGTQINIFTYASA